MKVYISSSWKNREQVRDMAQKIRNIGYEVYDFTDSECRKTPAIPPEKYPEEFDPEKHMYKDYIRIPEYIDAVNENKEAVSKSDIIILLLPCGIDSHSDWALGVGMGKTTIVVGHPQKGERSPVHNWADFMFDTVEEVIKYLKEWN
jgi:hypothetical protein